MTPHMELLRNGPDTPESCGNNRGRSFYGPDVLLALTRLEFEKRNKCDQM